MDVENGPTSEPTVLTGRHMNFAAEGPTSEPTVLTGKSMHLQAGGPTSEPTEYRHHMFAHLQADSVPTSEPTEYRCALRNNEVLMPHLIYL